MNPLPDNDFWYSALVSFDGAMYRFGGGGYTAPKNYIHKYDTATDTWTSIATLPVALHAPSATVFDGKIYVGGGYNAVPVNEVRVFMPATYNFKNTSPLPEARSYHEFVTIDSCVYSVGGHNNLFPDMDKSLIRLCSFTVSLDEEYFEDDILIYPNPADKRIFVMTERKNKSYIINIYNQLGELVINEINASNTIDISKLSRGLYIVEIESGKQIIREKLIVE